MVSEICNQHGDFFKFQILMKDILRPYVPEYKGQVTCEDGERILF